MPAHDHPGLPGWLPGVRQLRSPNCDARPRGTAVELLVIHNISLPPGRLETDAIEALFANRLPLAADPFFALIGELRVSSHFVIDRTGWIAQFVSCEDRAWHAGASQFGGRAQCNDFSIGIELVGSDFTGFESHQYAALAELTAELRRRYPLCAVRGHQHIAPERKTDPGPLFDWKRFARDAALPESMLPWK